ncbi:hypothetical protein GQR58_009461 [Nymphon striatum]|nr:hypothetical protein GQR58_009461 [Nymphon striatum]
MSFLSILVIDGSFSVKFVDMLSFDRDITAVYDRFGSFSKDTLMKLGDFNTIRVNGITDIGLDMENIKKIFQDSLHEIKSKEYDIFDPKVKQFNADYEHFMDKIKDIEVESSIDSILSCNVLKISKGTISVNFTDELCLLIRETGLMLKMGLKVPAIAAMIHRKESQLKKARDKLLDTCTKKADILEMKNQSIYNAIDEIFNLYNQYSGRKDYDLTDINVKDAITENRPTELMCQIQHVLFANTAKSKFIFHTELDLLPSYVAVHPTIEDVQLAVNEAAQEIVKVSQCVTQWRMIHDSV